MYFATELNRHPVEIKTQLASLYRRELRDELDLIIEPIQQQQDGADCGLFAAAVCLTVALGSNSTSVKWRQNRMRQHLKKCLEAKHLTAFPSVAVKRSENRRTQITIPLICACRLPEYAFKYLAKCTNCQKLQHKS